MGDVNFASPKISLGEKIPVPPLKPLQLEDVPMWTKLPYDTKHPSIECSGKNISLSREKLGESLYPNFPSKEFDLTLSPLPVPEDSAYDSLHDPYLRSFFQSAKRYRNLVRKGLVSKDGRVKSRLKDYNQYRTYLYKLWAMQVNQLTRAQMSEERKRMESILQAHDSEDPLYRSIVQKYDKLKVEEILREVSSKVFQNNRTVAEFGLSPLVQSAIQWRIYQQKLQKDLNNSYSAVKKWLGEKTKHYKQCIETKLNARRNREKKHQGRWERIFESSRARLEKELKLRELQKEKKKALSEKRYKRAKSLWDKNEREIITRSKKLSESTTSLIFSDEPESREWRFPESRYPPAREFSSEESDSAKSFSQVDKSSDSFLRGKEDEKQKPRQNKYVAKGKSSEINYDKNYRSQRDSSSKLDLMKLSKSLNEIPETVEHKKCGINSIIRKYIPKEERKIGKQVTSKAKIDKKEQLEVLSDKSSSQTKYFSNDFQDYPTEKSQKLKTESWTGHKKERKVTTDNFSLKKKIISESNLLNNEFEIPSSDKQVHPDENENVITERDVLQKKASSLSSLGEDQFKLLNYLYGLPELPKRCKEEDSKKTVFSEEKDFKKGPRITNDSITKSELRSSVSDLNIVDSFEGKEEKNRKLTKSGEAKKKQNEKNLKSENRYLTEQRVRFIRTQKILTDEDIEKKTLHNLLSYKIWDYDWAKHKKSFQKEHKSNTPEFSFELFLKNRLAERESLHTPTEEIMKKQYRDNDGKSSEGKKKQNKNNLEIENKSLTQQRNKFVHAQEKSNEQIKKKIMQNLLSYEIWDSECEEFKKNFQNHSPANIPKFSFKSFLKNNMKDKTRYFNTPTEEKIKKCYTDSDNESSEDDNILQNINKKKYYDFRIKHDYENKMPTQNRVITVEKSFREDSVLQARLKSEYLSTALYKHYKNKLDMEFHDMLLKSKKQSQFSRKMDSSIWNSFSKTSQLLSKQPEQMFELRSTPYFDEKHSDGMDPKADTKLKSIDITPETKISKRSSSVEKALENKGEEIKLAKTSGKIIKSLNGDVQQVKSAHDPEETFDAQEYKTTSDLNGDVQKEKSAHDTGETFDEQEYNISDLIDDVQQKRSAHDPEETLDKKEYKAISDSIDDVQEKKSAYDLEETFDKQEYKAISDLIDDVQQKISTHDPDEIFDAKVYKAISDSIDYVQQEISAHDSEKTFDTTQTFDAHEKSAQDPDKLFDAQVYKTISDSIDYVQQEISAHDLEKTFDAHEKSAQDLEDIFDAQEKSVHDPQEKSAHDPEVTSDVHDYKIIQDLIDDILIEKPGQHLAENFDKQKSKDGNIHAINQEIKTLNDDVQDEKSVLDPKETFDMQELKDKKQYDKAIKSHRIIDEILNEVEIRQAQAKKISKNENLGIESSAETYPVSSGTKIPTLTNKRENQYERDILKSCTVKEERSEKRYFQKQTILNEVSQSIIKKLVSSVQEQIEDEKEEIENIMEKGKIIVNQIKGSPKSKTLKDTFHTEQDEDKLKITESEEFHTFDSSYSDGAQSIKSESKGDREIKLKSESEGDRDAFEDLQLFFPTNQIFFLITPINHFIPRKEHYFPTNTKKDHWSPAHFSDKFHRRKMFKRETKFFELAMTDEKDLIVPSDVKCFDASYIAERVIRIHPRDMLSLIESSAISRNNSQLRQADKDEDKQKCTFGVSTILCNQTQPVESIMDKNGTKSNDDIAMLLEINKLKSPTAPEIVGIEDSTKVRQDENMDLPYFEIQKNTPMEIIKKNRGQFSYFDLRKRNRDLNAATDFIFTENSSRHNFVISDANVLLYRVLKPYFRNLITRNQFIAANYDRNKDVQEFYLETAPKYMDGRHFQIIAKEEETKSDSEVDIHSYSSSEIIIAAQQDTNRKTITKEDIPLKSDDGENDDAVILTAKEIRPQATLTDESKHNSKSERKGDFFSPFYSPYKSLPLDEISRKIFETCHSQFIKSPASNEEKINDAGFDFANGIFTAPITGLHRQSMKTDASIHNQDSPSYLKNLDQTERTVRNDDVVHGTLTSSPENKSTSWNNSNIGPPPERRNISMSKEFSLNVDKSQINIDDINSISLNINFSESSVKARLNDRKFQIFLNNCIADIINKCKENKSVFFTAEIDSDLNKNEKELKTNELNTDNINRNKNLKGGLDNNQFQFLYEETPTDVQPSCSRDYDFNTKQEQISITDETDNKAQRSSNHQGNEFCTEKEICFEYSKQFQRYNPDQKIIHDNDGLNNLEKEERTENPSYQLHQKYETHDLAQHPLKSPNESCFVTENIIIPSINAVTVSKTLIDTKELNSDENEVIPQNYISFKTTETHGKRSSNMSKGTNFLPKIEDNFKKSRKYVEKSGKHESKEKLKAKNKNLIIIQDVESFCTQPGRKSYEIPIRLHSESGKDSTESEKQKGTDSQIKLNDREMFDSDEDSCIIEELSTEVDKNK